MTAGAGTKEPAWLGITCVRFRGSRVQSEGCTWGEEVRLQGVRGPGEDVARERKQSFLYVEFCPVLAVTVSCASSLGLSLTIWEMGCQMRA